jgi:hypothetical protein
MSSELEMGKKLLSELRDDWAAARVWLDSQGRVRVDLPNNRKLAAFDSAFIREHRAALVEALRAETPRPRAPRATSATAGQEAQQ